MFLQEASHMPPFGGLGLSQHPRGPVTVSWLLGCVLWTQTQVEGQTTPTVGGEVLAFAFDTIRH